MRNIFHSPAERHGGRYSVRVLARTTIQCPFNMVLMESYFFCGSVRLGVFIISAVALVKTLVIVYVISTQGLDFTLSIIENFNKNISYRASYYIVRDTIFWLKQYPKTVFVVLQLYSFGHIMSCIIAAYGAYKLKKLFVIPLAVFEFLYLVEIITLITLFLRILRHFLSLNHLILITVTATGYAMLVAYDFLTLVAFEQIVRLVKSKRYQELYGPDPFNPILNYEHKSKAPPFSEPFGFSTPRKQLQEHPIIIYVIPKWDNVPKWWQEDNSAPNSSKEKEEVEKYFQSQELLPNVMFRNGLNAGYNKRQRLQLQ